MIINILIAVLANPTMTLLWGNAALDGLPHHSSRAAGTSNKQGNAAVAGVRIRAGAFDSNGQQILGAYSEETWIQEFCRTPGNEFFVEVRSAYTGCRVRAVYSYRLV